ncbi:hypothetical protein QE152_g26673 [Popillia japonica]|uniref:Uncharacterized protein n=1 Tax=Popillia japonica TaxID=7064 RepID=A0AAW1JWW1_POPJA
MCHVDALSRNPAGEPEETECAAGLLVYHAETGQEHDIDIHNPDESDDTSDEDYEDSENEQMTMQAEENLSDGNETVEPEPPVGPIKPKRERKRQCKPKKT